MKSPLTRARLFCGFFEPFFFLHILRLSCAHLISSSIMAVTFACESRCARKLAYMCRMPARLSAISEGELTTKICQLRLQCEFQKFTFPSNDMLHISWASKRSLAKDNFSSVALRQIRLDLDCRALLQCKGKVSFFRREIYWWEKDGERQ